MPEPTIPESELTFTFARSGGPGGQNVNKVNTKAILRWDIAASDTLPPAVKARFVQRFGNRITEDGELVIASDRFRSQARNKTDCIDRLHAMVLEVLHPPKPRKATRPTKAAKKRRLEGKRQQARKKQLRKPPRMDD